ncbi:MAG TPA: hypothetical protein VMU39_27515 [Solirubrobacteraceae bacterium]|nr:hypothetical protein [Solirubrobacteraceae bacterium]
MPPIEKPPGNPATEAAIAPAVPSGEDTAAATAAPPAAPAPSYVTREELAGFRNDILQAQRENLEFLARTLRPAPAAPAAPTFEDVPDEQLASGDPAAIRRQAEIAAARASHRQQEALQGLSGLGIPAMTKQALWMAKQQMDPELYKAYQREIDAGINGLKPEDRVDPDNILGVYSFVVGSHLSEIRAREREQALRANATGAAVTPATSGRSVSSTATSERKLEEVLPPEARRALKEFGASTGRPIGTEREQLERLVMSSGRWKSMDEWLAAYEAEGNA